MALLGNADLVAASPRRVKSRLEHSNWRAWLRHSRFYHVSRLLLVSVGHYALSMRANDCSAWVPIKRLVLANRMLKPFMFFAKPRYEALLYPKYFLSMKKMCSILLPTDDSFCSMLSSQLMPSPIFMILVGRLLMRHSTCQRCGSCRTTS